MSGMRWDRVRREDQARRPVTSRERGASVKQRATIDRLLDERGAKPSHRLATMTSRQASDEIARLKGLPRQVASDAQRNLLLRMAEERGVNLDLGKRLAVQRFEIELARLKALPAKRKRR